ncbi:class I SAM-dependent methyltransferase [Nocardia macrotermitis]|uniref:Methyltransferase MycE N-terminal domain-containing protein n=1 Tax=Nocardia macrotermitis TaxID=2585198 RepID=A0A7K0D1A1_9NOCA|nr:class I SAM-dependent methyltransferase [Nocardia macrotermitis]MQY19002.1 hypothetical protein [Nocardia macrotermitis]
MTRFISDTHADRLFTAAGSDGDTLTECIANIGSERVARTVLAELLDRAPLRGRPPADILFRMHMPSTTVELGILVDDVAKTAVTAPPAEPTATIEQSLPEMVRMVFGPRSAAPCATRVLRWADPPFAARTQVVFETVRLLLDAIDHTYRPGLAEFCIRYGSDKWGGHQYSQWYERHFEPIRDRRLTILEIGVGGYHDVHEGGASLRMWQNYFPRARIYGLDIFDKTHMSRGRMTVLQGDQSDPEDLARVLDTTGPLDIVIDDGSHRSEHVLTTFETLFPALREGGLYAIEDLQTSYWSAFGGRPPGPTGVPTSMEFLKLLLDGVNHEEIDGREPQATDAHIRGLHFYHNLAILEKGANREGGGPQWMRG